MCHFGFKCKWNHGTNWQNDYIPGAFLDNGLSFKHHITTKCRIAMWNLQPLQPSLTVQACMTLVLGLVMSHLDYVNSAFIGLPASDINKVQRVQNAAAKLVLNLKRMDSSTEALKNCIGCPSSLEFNSKCLNGLAPSYLMELLELKSTMSRLGLRSTCDRTLLCIPFNKRKTFADRSFSVVGPRLWNGLPKSIRESPNPDCFKKHLKTYLFDIAF